MLTMACRWLGQERTPREATRMKHHGRLTMACRRLGRGGAQTHEALIEVLRAALPSAWSLSLAVTEESPRERQTAWTHSAQHAFEKNIVTSWSMSWKRRRFKTAREKEQQKTQHKKDRKTHTEVRKKHERTNNQRSNTREETQNKQQTNKQATNKQASKQVTSKQASNKQASK